MDDSCAVCADTLEWVSYGACGHREVCSTCVARLRFIIDDRRCCICKTESDVVFVTKALGDYTRMINDFSVLPSKPREGRVGSYWYHEDTQAFFDDAEHYKMVKAMCRLSCSVCDKAEDETNDGAKRRSKFRNIEHLKGHLFHKHKVVMCSLCLEGRKVFICEQKLYTRSQLVQHISTGDSEVDGSESERGGFSGHPKCEFCETPFYGENELYSHMTRDHYTCHICQRQHPGNHDYFINYENLEMHFRRDHFLCEDESCLAKKFVVFQSEAELKRHNTIEHGGRMSRSKRNAALQIPTSFRFHREQDPRRGRGRTSRRDESDNQISMAIQASVDASFPRSSSHDPLPSSGTQVAEFGGGNDIDPDIQPLDSLALTESTPSRYLQALGHSSRNGALQESAFPPLAMAPSSSQQKPTEEPEGLPNTTMATHIRRKNNKATVVSSPQGWTTSNGPLSSSSTQWPAINTAPSISHTTFSSPSVSSHASPPVRAVHAPGNQGSTSRMSHSASAPSLSESRLSRPSVGDFPPVSATQVRKTPPAAQVVLNVEDVHTANRSLVEKIRDALKHDEAKYASFKEISGQYREGSISTPRYLDNVREFGLSHLVIELASLCPDPQKRQELVGTYYDSLESNSQQEKVVGRREKPHLQESKGTTKKGKGISTEGSSSRDRLADNIINSVRTLQPNHKSQEEEVEVLSKDGYRNYKGKSSSMADQRSFKQGGQHDSTSGDGSNQITRDEVGGNKQKKKTPKFQRARLGDGSMAAILDARNSEPEREPGSLGETSDGNGLPVRGVWRKGGSKKLFA
ncbi:E3 ubiquitin-protein ligase hel2 [Linum grandiflorum]